MLIKSGGAENRKENRKENRLRELKSAGLTALALVIPPGIAESLSLEWRGAT